MKKGFSIDVPKEVSQVTEVLRKNGFEAYVVGGCIRDSVLGIKPKDWDITTNATPEQIQPLFSNTFYENDFGTVGIVNEETKEKTLEVVEVTPYRIESAYSDKRRPDSVKFSEHIEDDLKRRDFTINAIAYDEKSGEVVDLHDGISDIKKKIIRTVGDPETRFSEDALRILRAIRLQAELGFQIEGHTLLAMGKQSELLSHISKERVRDEFTRIIMSDSPKEALEIAQKLKILKFIAPELEKGIGVEQTQAHAFDVWTHLLNSLQHAAKRNYPLEVRLAALFHDISKPETRRKGGGKNAEWTFYGHEVVGARVTKKILENLRFSKEIIEKVVKLVRWHMFFSDTEQITLSAVRRMVANVGKDNIWDLVNVRICDRIGTGRPKENPYRFRKYQAMIEEAMRDPISVSMLKLDGNKLIEVIGEKPGPRIGFILHALLEEVFDDPKKNTEEYLSKKARELAKLSNKELQEMGERGKEAKAEKEEEAVQEIRKKHWVE